jgi:D-sedoheptulose 7-phosphate isomerase
MQQAHSMGITTVALTGASGGQMSQLAQYALAVPSSETNHIQEMHIAVGHLICELIERALYAN